MRTFEITLKDLEKKIDIQKPFGRYLWFEYFRSLKDYFKDRRGEHISYYMELKEGQEGKVWQWKDLSLKALNEQQKQLM